MSQKVTRKGPIAEEKEKRHTDSPVKEMKKKMAANAEKEKQAVEKEKTTEKSTLNEKQTEKPEKSTKNTEKSDKKDKPAEKIAEKIPEKKTDKSEKRDKILENTVEKKEKPADKKEAVVAPTEKAKEESKENGKPDTPDKQKRETAKPKQNGTRQNGDADATVSSDEEDGLFPELAYEDSDLEGFEPPTPEGPSRSYTRRSQVKASRTPETPRPPSDKQTDKDYVPDDPTKLLKLKEDIPSDRKLRSSDSPKRQDKKEKTDSPKPQEIENVEGAREENNEEASVTGEGKKDAEEKVEVVIAVEVESEEPRKSDTNFSKSRVKVSPYRRSVRAADHTQTSIVANYTGNNTTMEMDLTETSMVSEEPSSIDSPYLSGLRSIRGRRSYKPLKEMSLRHIGVNTSLRSNASEQSIRPTGTVVGRKRKPDGDAHMPTGGDTPHPDAETRSKRAKLLERLGGLARPFRFAATTDRICVESTAEIVGINTDLPLTAPVATPDTFDPESIKHVTSTPVQPRVPSQPRDKRCSIM